MGITTDRNDPDIKSGKLDETPTEQSKKYLVLSDDELAKGFVCSVRTKYIHKICGIETIIGQKIAETYARDLYFYGFTYCCFCKMHRPVTEFVWSGTNVDVGS